VLRQGCIILLLLLKLTTKVNVTEAQRLAAINVTEAQRLAAIHGAGI
jgi:hypothetical protein